MAVTMTMTMAMAVPAVLEASQERAQPGRDGSLCKSQGDMGRQGAPSWH